MADSKFCKDEEQAERTRKENDKLVMEIVDFCNRSDYKKHKVLLVGQSGSGKSSVINTVLKVVTGKYFPRAKAGAGNVTTKTLELTWYPNCAANPVDFEHADKKTEDKETVSDNRGKANLQYQKEFRSVLDKLPDLFDVAGMKNMNDQETKEILSLLIGGFINPNTSIALLEKEQKKKGLGWLQTKYRTAKDEYKMSLVLFVCSCTTTVPHDLIKCVRDVIEDVDPKTSHRKYDCDVFVLITKFDKLEPDAGTAKSQANQPETLTGNDSNSLRPMSETDKPGDTITLDKFKKIENEIAQSFVMTGNFQDSHLQWASYSDSIKPDNVHVDNRSLKLLKYLTTPLHTDQKVDTSTIRNRQHGATDTTRNWQHEAKDIIRNWLHEAGINMEFMLKRFFEQHCQTDISTLLAVVVGLIVVLSAIYLSLNSIPGRR